MKSYPTMNTILDKAIYDLATAEDERMFQILDELAVCTSCKQDRYQDIPCCEHEFFRRVIED